VKPEFRLVRRTIYKLKRAFPQRIQLCRTSQNTLNVETGLMQDVTRTLNIRRAILLPARLIRDFSYDLSFIAANKNFTYGGFYDPKQRRIIIDRRDIPSDFTVDMNMHVMFNDKRHEVKEVIEYEEMEVVALIVVAVQGALPLNDISATLSNEVTLDDEVTS
jgi:hypothetical protein